MKYGIGSIASVWAVALIGGWLLRACLPSHWFLHFWMVVYPARRVAFWACLIAASIVTMVWVIRLCVQDLRIQ